MIEDQTGSKVSIDYRAPQSADVVMQNAILERSIATKPDGIAVDPLDGNRFGALIGAAIIGVIENVIVLLGVSPCWQTIVSGAIVVLAISFDSIHRNFMQKGS